MRILIIGGTGLISTAITRLLVERGDAEYPFYDRIITNWERLGEQFAGAPTNGGESA